MSPHHVPFNKYKKDLKRAEVLKLISQGYSTKQIARRLNCGVSGCRKLIRRLKNESFITENNLLTTRGKDIIDRCIMGGQNVPSFGVPQDTIRLHDLVIKIRVDDQKWKQKREEILKLNIKGSHTWETVGGKQTWFPYDLNTSVRITSKSIMIKLPDVYGSTPIMVKEEALKIFYIVRQRLEQLLKIRLEKTAEFNFCVVSNQHIALIQDEIAKFFLKENITLRIYDTHGDILWVVDNSMGLAELEAVHKEKAEECAENIKSLIYDVSTKKSSLPSVLTKEISYAKEELHRLQKALEQQAQMNSEIITSLGSILASQTNMEGVREWN